MNTSAGWILKRTDDDEDFYFRRVRERRKKNHFTGELEEIEEWSGGPKNAMVFPTLAEAVAMRKELEDPKGIKIIDLNKPA